MINLQSHIPIRTNPLIYCYWAVLSVVIFLCQYFDKWSFKSFCLSLGQSCFLVCMRTRSLEEKLERSSAISIPDCFSGSLSVVDRREKLWNSEICLDILWSFWLALCRTATNQKIPKIFKDISLSQGLSRRPTIGKTPEDSGVEIGDGRALHVWGGGSFPPAIPQDGSCSLAIYHSFIKGLILSIDLTHFILNNLL